MFSVSDLFKRYISKYDREFECRATIGGVTYENNKVVNFEVEDNLASSEELEIGSVVASKITIALRTQDIIPVNAKISPEIRLNGTDGYTEWVPAGSYYIDNRNCQNNVWTLVGYDKLIMTNQLFVSSLVYPASMINVLNEICVQLGVTLDPGVVINPAYMIPYKDLEITIRDMLSCIASAHGACCQITKSEKLTFVKFNKATTPSLTVTPSDYVTVTQTNNIKTYTRIVVTYNTDGEFLEAGTGDDDHTLKFYNQFITQEILDDIFAAFNGFSYIPIQMPWRGNFYSEVGDAVSIGKGSLVIWSEYEFTWAGAEMPWDGVEYFNTIVLRNKLTFKGGLKTEWTSPSSSAQKSEFGFKGTLTQKVQNLEKTAVKEEKPYNGVVIGRTNGIVVTRSDGKVVSTLNATEGISIEIDGSPVFEVVPNEDGTASLQLTGKIIMRGGSISWSDVTPPTADDVGARPDNWTPTAAQVGALPVGTPIPDDAHITTITRNTVTTSFVNALRITAKSITTDDGTGKVEIVGGVINFNALMYGLDSSNLITMALFPIPGLIECKTLKAWGDNATYTSSATTILALGMIENLKCNTNAQIGNGGSGSGIIDIGYLTVTGSKNSLQKTANYGERLINAYETADYYFGDIGSAVIGSEGQVTVAIDEIFLECVNTKIAYHVFTQIYKGQISSIDRFPGYFTVYGSPSTEFSWELKAKRIGYEYDRLEVFDEGNDVMFSNIESELDQSIENILLEV